jgi:tetratricopeptide (TPR) repeat protein
VEPFRPRLVGTALTLSLALSAAAPLAVVPLEVHAAGPSPNNDASLEEARELYSKGKAAYETFQYEAAIDLWTEALAKLPPDRAGIRNRMVYNIATAQEKQYDLDKDISRLRNAAMLLERWIEEYKLLFKKTAETQAEVERAEARLEELRQKIAAAESGQDAATVTTEPETGAPEPETAGASKEVGFESDFDVPPDVLDHRKRIAAENRAQGFIAGGWTALGLGFLFTVAGVGTIIGLRHNRLGVGGGIAGTVIGVAGMAAGGALLGVGYKKKKAVEAGDYSLAPTFGPGHAGLSFSGRF